MNPQQFERRPGELRTDNPLVDSINHCRYLIRKIGRTGTVTLNRLTLQAPVNLDTGFNLSSLTLHITLADVLLASSG